MVQFSNLDTYASKNRMSKGNFLINVSFALLAAVVIIFSITHAYAQTSDVSAQTVRWEYKVLDYTWWGSRSTENSLNKLGNEGWELVSFSVKQSDSSKFVYILKRRLPIGSFSDHDERSSTLR